MLLPGADVRLLSNPQRFRLVTSGDEFFAESAIGLHPLFHSTHRTVLESRLGRFGWHSFWKSGGDCNSELHERQEK